MRLLATFRERALQLAKVAARRRASLRASSPCLVRHYMRPQWRLMRDARAMLQRPCAMQSPLARAIGPPDSAPLEQRVDFAREYNR